MQLAGQTIGRLENEEFLDLEIALGKHDISIFYYQFPFSFDWGDLSLQAIAGETYYLRLRLVRVQPRPLGYFAKSDEEPIAGRYKVNLLRDFRVPEMARREIEQTRRTQ